MERFALDEEDAFRAFVKATPRALVLLRGVGCAYSAAFERTFTAERAPEGWSRVVRQVEEGGRGPVGEALGVEVTPTVVAFVAGAEAARLPGKLLVGISRGSYLRWLRTLARVDLSGR